MLAAIIISNGILFNNIHHDLASTQSRIAELTSNKTSPAPSLNASTSLAQRAANLTMIELINLIQPTIVRITVSAPGIEASGSGVIIRNSGYIITNHHVIENATSINITLYTQKQYSASVMTSDSNLDLAILKMAAGKSNLPYAELASISDVIVGQEVVAGGFPIG